MSERETAETASDGRGCVAFIGLIIIAICIGNIYTATAGWLALGIGLFLLAIL